MFTCPHTASVPSDIKTLSESPIKYSTGELPFPIKRDPLLLFKSAVIIAPAAATFIASVTSAFCSMLLNFVLSSSDIIIPDPALDTSERDVTLLLV